MADQDIDGVPDHLDKEMVIQMKRTLDAIAETIMKNDSSLAELKRSVADLSSTLVQELRSEIRGHDPKRPSGRRLSGKNIVAAGRRKEITEQLGAWAEALYSEFTPTWYHRAKHACSAAAMRAAKVEEAEHDRFETVPWVAEIMWGRRGGRNSEDNSDNDMYGALTALADVTISELVLKILKRLVRFFLLAWREHFVNQQSASGKERVWDHFWTEDASLCEATLKQLQEQTPEQTHVGGQAHSGMRLFAAVLVGMIRDTAFEQRVIAMNADLEGTTGYNSRLTENPSLGSLLHVVVQAAVVRSVFPKGELAKAGSKRSVPDSGSDVSPGCGGTLEGFDILTKFAASLASKVRHTGTEIGRRLGREEFWRKLGFPVYSTVRKRAGWKIEFHKDVDVCSRSVFAESVLGLQANDGYEIPDAHVVPVDKKLGPDFPVDVDHEERDRSDAQRDFLLKCSEAGERNVAVLKEMREHFPYMTVTVCFPVKPEVAHLEAGRVEQLKSDLESFTGEILPPPTDRNKLHMLYRRPVDLHEVALELLMKWADITDIKAFLVCCKDSLRAVHAVALSLFAAVRLAIKGGDVDKLTRPETLFLGNLRFFQITKSSSSGTCEAITTTPGLVTVFKMPYEDLNRQFENDCEEDRQFMTTSAHQALWGGGRKRKSGTDMMFKRLPLDEFYKLMDNTCRSERTAAATCETGRQSESGNVGDSETVDVDAGWAGRFGNPLRGIDSDDD